MNRHMLKCIVGSAAVVMAHTAVAGTDIFFNPLTQSAAVATPNHINELNSPWQTPPGLGQVNLTSLSEVEADGTQSIVRVPGLGTGAAMFDMSAFTPDGRYLFVPHETAFGAGVSRYDTVTDRAVTLFSGDLGGAGGDWSSDFGAFDPALWTPHDTLFLAEEWSGEGRVIEVLNPLADPADIEIRELDAIPNVAHEGLRFSHDGRTLYFIDEWNSGSIYKYVPTHASDYTKGQTFVLVVDGYAGDPVANWNSGLNVGATRTGLATWVPLTDAAGNALTVTDPFKNGPSSDPVTDPNARGGRGAADEIGGTPYGRPEDVEVGRLGNGREALYFNATSEQAVYSVEMLSGNKAIVRLAASEADTPKNLGFPATTGVLNSPDNLAQDALGNIYVVEDAPNGSSVGGDIWFLRDADSNGVAESLDHFMSLQVDGSESTGMIFNPADPTQFVVSVQHPDSTDVDNVPGGFGDAVWEFDLSRIVPPPCNPNEGRYGPTCVNTYGFNFVEMLERAGRSRGHHRDRDHDHRR